MGIHLKFDLIGSSYNFGHLHPHQVMDSFGISFQHQTPQSIGDQIWYWNCVGIPDKLPSFITILDVNPIDMVGFGLSLEMAKKIIKN